jgi:phage shock protein A
MNFRTEPEPEPNRTEPRNTNSSIATRLSKLEDTVNNVVALLKEIIEKGEEEEARAEMEVELSNKPIPQSPSRKVRQIGTSCTTSTLN